MLRVIEGVPGSGKTYYAVQYLSKFCVWDKIYNVYNINSDVLLVTNIDEIKVSHMSVDQFLSQSLYIVDNIKEYMKQYNYKKVIMVVDEAQRYFSREALKNFPNENDLFFFFEYHRHIGVDIFLICQTISAIHSRIVKLSEYIIRARQSSVSLPMVFIYDAVDSITGDILFSVRLKKESEIFRLYKSFEFEGHERPKSVLLRKWVVGVSLFAIPLLLAVLILKSGFLFGGIKKSKQTQTKQHVQSVQSQSVQQQPVQQQQPSQPVQAQPKGIPLNQFVQTQQVQTQQIQGKTIFPSATHLLVKKAPPDGYEVQGIFCNGNDCYMYAVSSSYMQQKYFVEKEKILSSEGKTEEKKEEKNEEKKDKQNDNATYFGRRNW